MRRNLARRNVVTVLVAVFAASAFAVPAAADPSVAPGQMIVVSAPTADSPTATLSAYERVDDGWRAVLGPTRADLGSLGVGAPEDDVFRTPEGTFPLGQAFGREVNPGTRMPYFQATDEDWWDEDVDSPTYNTHVHAEEIASDDAENLYDSGPIYDYAVLIDHNPERIPGRSAGIFLHVSDGEPTWGCVAIDRDQMRSVLQWLDPAAHPHITIRVGSDGPPAL
ncbi:L,D-peptidoglycan transpeptidase YkuD (ErfK/YbiS/YcfS/YnhG family) [Mycolicibacterium iranicum]|uniref:L,D-peptidoglycan transpeptidase YkuD (ErfK/YbiS/YcfS/YnhG family) n=1 Tax=Mycolicibacterium iranicum TaxID=912594 RepID=A0A839Q7D6_MYCIR|nr:L,D-transpeptidase family protein [Mycolicibacterium iranicum]MBB2990764.1 L,D-peptidoglycan transpeptidase YkuD (ErfK/YbiS/YcfS/YnhG family) [Mycolicibacterium iranicum]